MHLRQAPWHMWGDIFGLDVDFICLQPGDNSTNIRNIERLWNRKVIQPTGLDTWHDVEGVAALIACLDLVITVPNSIAHISGAVGVDGVVISSSKWSCFWLLHDESIPWYPSLQLLVEGSELSWSELAVEVTKRILAKVDGANGGG